MVLSGFSLSNVATMTSNVISVNTCQLKIAHGGWGGELLILYFRHDYGHQRVRLTMLKNRLRDIYAFQKLIFKNK